MKDVSLDLLCISRLSLNCSIFKIYFRNSTTKNIRKTDDFWRISTMWTQWNSIKIVFLSVKEILFLLSKMKTVKILISHLSNFIFHDAMCCYLMYLEKVCNEIFKHPNINSCFIYINNLVSFSGRDMHCLWKDRW